MFDTVLHAIASFVGNQSALLTGMILVLLLAGLSLCYLTRRVRFTTREIAFLGMLTALHIVMAEVCKITVIPNVLVLSFGFLPLALCGMLFGPVAAVTVAVIGDIVGALLFSSGDFYFGYTLTAFLTGLLYGIFLHKKPLSVWRCVLCQILVSMLCYAFLNSVWALNWVTKTAASEYIGTRLLFQPILFPVYLALLLLMRRYRSSFERVLKK